MKTDIFLQTGSKGKS